MSTMPPQPPPPAQPIPMPPGAPPARDTTMGWLAHLLLLFTCFIGPLVIWLTKKDTDKYAAFHGKQATFWWLAVFAVFICLGVLSFLLALIAGPLAIVGNCLIWVLSLGNLAYVIFGIVYTAQGKPFKYFFIADQFCKQEFAEAYPEIAAQQPPPA